MSQRTAVDPVDPNVAFRQLISADGSMRLAHAGIRILFGMILAIVAGAQAGIFSYKAELSPAAIQQGPGKSFAADLRGIAPEGWVGLFYHRQPDSNETPRRSRVRMSENGRPLGPPHSDHQSMAEIGGGRYSHWGEHILFTTTDNTDPRSNGRHYVLTWRPNLWVPLLPLAALLLSLLAFGNPRSMPEVAALRDRRHQLKTAFEPQRWLPPRETLWRSSHVAIRILVVLMVATIAAERAGLFTFRVEVPSTAIQPGLGHSFAINLKSIGPQGWAGFFYDRHPDSNDNPRRSRLRLTENGRPLGPPHSNHQSLGKAGAGQYSHWGADVLFTTSNNTDPRSNGRHYIVTWKASLWALLLPFAALLGVIAAFGRPDLMAEVSFLRTHRERFSSISLVLIRSAQSSLFWFATTASLAAYIVWCFAFYFPPVPLIAWDTSSYWSGSSVIPIGYTVFLRSMYSQWGSLQSVIIAQVSIYCLSVLCLQRGIQILTASATFAGFVALILLTYPGQLINGPYLLTEQLFLACLVLHAAAATWSFARNSRASLIGLALSAVVALSIRPAAAFLFGGPLFLLLFWRGQRMRVLRWAVIPLVVFTAAYTAATYAVRGAPVQTTGYGLFPHVGHLYPGGSKSISPEEDKALIQAMAPFAQQYAQRDSALERYVYGESQYSTIMAEVFKALPLDPIKYKDFSYDDSLREYNAKLQALANYTIVREPLGYLRVIFDNVYGSWVRNAFVVQPLSGDSMKVLYRAFAPSTSWFFEQTFRPAGVMERLEDAYPHLRGIVGQKGGETAGALGPKFDVDKDGHRFRIFNAGYPLPQLDLYPWRSYLVILFAVLSFCALLKVIFSRSSAETWFVAYCGVLAFGGTLFAALVLVVFQRYVVPLETFALLAITVGLYRVVQLAIAWLRRHSPDFERAVPLRAAE